MADVKVKSEQPVDIAMQALHEAGTDAVKCGHVCRHCGELIKSPPRKSEPVLCKYCRCPNWIKLTSPEGGYACRQCGNLSDVPVPNEMAGLSCENCGSSDWIELPCAVIMVVNR